MLRMSLCAAVCLSPVMAVFAQTAPDSAAGQPEGPGSPAAGESDVLSTIVVTARRREENLQSVPIAVTALSGTEITKQNAVNLGDLGFNVPGFQIHPAGPNATAPVISIRGQVQTDVLPTLDPSVGIYVDGVYWSRSTGADAALVDVESVEVLKGPQGTLFGRNTTGGAVNIRTTDPNLDRVSGTLSVTGASYSELNETAILNLPIVADTLAARLDFNHNRHAGYGGSAFSGERGNTENTDTYRIKILALPAEGARVLLSYESFVINQNAPETQLSYYTPLLNQGAAAADALVGTGSTAILDQSLATRPGTSLANDSNHVTARTHTANLTASYDFTPGTIKAILGYRKVTGVSNLDLDGTPLTIFGITPQEDAATERTGELQFIGHGFDDRLQYTAGYYVFSESGSYFANVYAVTNLNPFNPSVEDASAGSRSQAGYFQTSYKITDPLSFTAGLRYSSDRKSMVSHNGTFGPFGFACAVPDDLGGPQATCSQEFKTSSSDLDYLASLEYKFTPDVLGYLKVSHGYRAGGLNLRGSQTAGSFAPFAPEKALNYEAGLKSEYFNQRVRVNLAGFYTDYTNIQRTVSVNLPPNTTATLVENAAKGKVYGGELEAQAVVAGGLRFGASVGVIEASYSQYADLLGNHVNEAFPHTPELKYSLSGDYTFPVPAGTLNLHADWGWQSKITFVSGYSDGGSDAAHFPLSSIAQNSYGLLNLRASWEITDLNLEIALFGRNVTDQKYRTSGVDFVDAGLGFNSVVYAAPAVWGGQITYKFGGR